MSIDKTRALIALAWFVIGGVCGFFIGKGIYQPTYGEKIARDTVYMRDTVFDYQPVPVDSAKVRYITRYLPVVKRVVDHFIDANNMVVTENVVAENFSANSASFSANDSVLVEVPITSKHYQSKDYDAWVSGYEPSLDSIKVYKETQYITETITRTVKDKGKHFFVSVAGGTEYNPNKQAFRPLAELRLGFKKNRWGVGVAGGCQSTDGKFEPFFKGMVSYELLGF